MPVVNSTQTIAGLRSVTGAANGDAYEVLGYYAARDGGGGTYVCDTSDTTSADNGGSIIVATDGKRWKIQNTNHLSVRIFGARGNGTDDTTFITKAIAAVGAGTLVWEPGTYLVTTGLSMPDIQIWQGLGGQRSVTLKKGGNFDLVTMGDRSAIFDMNLECQGTSYSGRGIYINFGYSQQISRVRVADAQGVAIDFAMDKGEGANLSAIEAFTTNPTVVPALKVRDSTACPRFFSGMWLSGGLADFQSGGNGCSFSNFYARNLLTDSSSSLLHISNGRFASLGDVTYLKGSDITITGVAFSGQVALQNAQGILLVACTTNGVTEDATNCQYNQIFDQRRSYSPVWTQATGTQPSLGNGSMTGSYLRSGILCTVSLRMVAGTTTTYGNDLTAYQFSLPLKGHLSVDQRGMPVVVTIGSTTYPCWASVGANEGLFMLQYNGQSVRLGYPAAFVAGSTIDAEISYMVR